MAEIDMVKRVGGWWIEVRETGTIKPNIKDSPGWLAPDGRYYPCEWAAHTLLAQELIKLDYPEQERVSYNAADDFLVQRGWHRVGLEGNIDSGFQGRIFSESQKSTLRELLTISKGQTQEQLLKDLDWIESLRS